MKLISTLSLILLAQTSLAHTPSKLPLHLDLEMSSKDYGDLLIKKHFSFKKMGHKNQKSKSIVEVDPEIEYAEKLGSRLSKWIELLNANRNPENAIRLTSAQTRRGIPIDKPNVYSPSIIDGLIKDILKDLPTEMKDVLTQTNDLPTTITIDDETFIKHARLIDRQYQSAVRYKLVDEYRREYAQAANADVRGYYYLTTNNITGKDLKDIRKIPKEKLPLIKEALVQICQNSTNDLTKCQKSLKKYAKLNRLAKFYGFYIEDAKYNWISFFKIPTGKHRSDVVWGETESTVPFNTPEDPKFIPYLQNNIEDEFRFKDWGLKMIFGTFEDGPRLKFEPGTVPHVNDLGGNEIVMDANQPIEEYESQWTIRHEFGHVLGLPDCYHEFYDVTKSAYVNYQLDITDLMCSRAGDMNERIYLELKRVYAP